MLEKVRRAGLAGVVVQNIGQLPLCRRAGVVPVGGFGINLTNSLAAKEWEALGISAFTASFEINLPKLRALPLDLTIGMVAYGHLPLMLLRCCPQRARGAAKAVNWADLFFSGTERGRGFRFSVPVCRKRLRRSC